MYAVPRHSANSLPESGPATMVATATGRPTSTKDSLRRVTATVTPERRPLSGTVSRGSIARRFGSTSARVRSPPRRRPASTAHPHAPPSTRPAAHHGTTGPRAAGQVVSVRQIAGRYRPWSRSRWWRPDPGCPGRQRLQRELQLHGSGRPSSKHQVARRHQTGRQRVFDEPGLAVARQPADPAVQSPGACVGQLLADVVQLAVEPGDGPADPRGGGRRGRDLAGARTAAGQRALTQRNHEQLLVRRERHATDGHLTRWSCSTGSGATGTKAGSSTMISKS